VCEEVAGSSSPQPSLSVVDSVLYLGVTGRAGDVFGTITIQHS